MHIYVASAHEGNKPFKCEICVYSSTQKGAMNIHIATVHEEKKHSNVTYVITVVHKTTLEEQYFIDSEPKGEVISSKIDRLAAI